MADQTAIEWCDSTFNPWIGCTRVSPACDDCYAARSAPARTRTIVWGPGEARQRTGEANWKEPARWEREHANFFAAHGRRRRVFCASLADVFDNEVPTAWRVDLLRLIEATPHLDWLLLTKRIGNVDRMLDDAADLMPEVLRWPLPNVWLGATVVNQAEADRDIPKLLAVPAQVRFLSVEPMLGPINLNPAAFAPCPNASGVVMDPTTGGTECCRRCDFTGVGDEMAVDWVIGGGESGPKARAMHPDWARSLRDQCALAGVPFLWKQWGEWAPAESIDDNDERVLAQRWMARDGREVNTDHGVDFFGGDTPMYRAGKKASGRLLDGVEHNGFPLP